jgi:hypothetical protein
VNRTQATCLAGSVTRRSAIHYAFWAIVFLGKRPSGQMSSCQMCFWANVFLGKCRSRQMSFWANVFWANVFWANVFLANVFLGKCLSGQMSYGQMLSRQMSFWANVFLGKCCLGKCPSGQTSYGQMSLDKCLWANVVWANVKEPLKQFKSSRVAQLSVNNCFGATDRLLTLIFTIFV